MKILHICTGWPLSLQGGITNYVRMLAQVQHETGLDIHVISGPDNEKYAFAYKPYSSSIKVFSYGRLVNKKGLSEIKKYIDDNCFDIIHIHALGGIDWDIYQAVKNYHYVVSLHDYYMLCPKIYMIAKDLSICSGYDEEKCGKCISYLTRFRVIRGGFSRLNKILHTNMQVPYIPQKIASTRYHKFSELLNNADYILPVSKKVEEIFRNSGITSKSRILHIGNVSAEQFEKDFQPDTAPHKIKILFLGRLCYEKGVDLFLRIAKEVHNNNIEFHFYGRAESYERKLQECGIINHGPYQQSDLKKILKSFDMGMLLSVWEDNGPQVVMELLNNHLPVIGTRMGGIPDFVNEKNGFLFNPYSETEISALYQFLEDLTLEKVCELKSNITPTMTFQEHHEELLQVYHNILQPSI